MTKEHCDISIETLKLELLQELKEHNYKPSTIQLYSEIINCIQRYMDRNKQSLYSPDTGKELLENDVAQKPYVESTARFFRTIVRRLDDCYFGRGYILSVPRKNLSVSESYQTILNSYYEHCKNIGNSDTTLKMKQRACHFFAQM